MALTLRALGGLVDRTDRTRVPGPDRDHEQAPGRARSTRSATRASPSPCRPTTSCPTGLGAVLAVVYLVFNQGWGAGRVDLAAEGDPARPSPLVELMPDEAEVMALLQALMLLHDARRGAGLARRLRRCCSTIRIASLWDEGPDRRRAGPSSSGAITPRRRRASHGCRPPIADLHLQQPRDWGQIAGSLRHPRPPAHRLAGRRTQPGRRRGRAGTVPRQGLATDGTAWSWTSLPLLPLQRGRKLLQRAGRTDEAQRGRSGRALELAQTDTERRSLQERLTRTAAHTAFASPLPSVGQTSA